MPMKAKNDSQWRKLVTSVTSQLYKPKSKESHDVTWWRETTALVRVNGYIIWGFLIKIDNIGIKGQLMKNTTQLDAATTLTLGQSDQ